MRVFASATASAFSWNDDVSACSAWMRRSSTCVAWCWRWRRAFSCARSLACWRERGRRRVSDSRSLRSRSNSASRCRSSSCSRARSIVGSTSKRLPTAVVIVTSVVIDPSPARRARAGTPTACCPRGSGTPRATRAPTREAGSPPRAPSSRARSARLVKRGDQARALRACVSGDREKSGPALRACRDIKNLMTWRRAAPAPRAKHVALP